MKKTYIQVLREKPVHERKRIAYGVSAAITVVITFVWVTSFSFFNGASPFDVTHQQVATTQSDSSSVHSPLSVIKQGFANAYQAVTGTKFNKDSADEALPVVAPALVYIPEQPTK